MRLVFGAFTGVFLIISLVILALKLWALIDALIQPERAYIAASKGKKVYWVVGLALAVLFAGVGFLGLAGLVAAIVYLVDVRPALRQTRGGYGDGYGGYR